MLNDTAMGSMPRPGSDEAIEQGCKCPVLDNNYGDGAYVGTDGEAVFWISGLCPIHGVITEKATKDADATTREDIVATGGEVVGRRPNMNHAAHWYKGAVWNGEGPYNGPCTVYTYDDRHKVSFPGDSQPFSVDELKGDFIPIYDPSDTKSASKISDGYHTFADLYEHRHALWAALLYVYEPIAFKTRRNQEGEEWPGWFIAGINTEMGQLSYHMPDEWWDRLLNVAEVERNSRYDGHTSDDVLQRIPKLQEMYEIGLPLLRRPRKQ